MYPCSVGSCEASPDLVAGCVVSDTELETFCVEFVLSVVVEAATVGTVVAELLFLPERFINRITAPAITATSTTTQIIIINDFFELLTACLPLILRSSFLQPLF